jgi:hypothetical protein
MLTSTAQAQRTSEIDPPQKVICVHLDEERFN